MPSGKRSVAAGCWQQAASKDYLVYLWLRGFVYALIGQVSPDREQPVVEFLRHPRCTATMGMTPGREERRVSGS